MIISTKRGTPAAELDKIIREFEAKGLSVTMIRGTDYNVFGLVGDTTVIDEKQVRANPYVENVQRVSEPYKKANRLFHEADSIIDVGGIKLAMLAYTFSTNGLPVDSEHPYSVSVYTTDYMTDCSVVDYDLIQSDLDKAGQSGADAIAVYVHWGNEYHTEPSEQQAQLADYLFAHGAILVLGGHAHVPQPMELRTLPDGRTGYLCYCLGNLISNQFDPYTNLTAAVTLTLTRSGETGQVTVSGAEYAPMFMLHASDSNEGRYRLLDIRKSMQDFEQGDTSVVNRSVYDRMKQGRSDLHRIFGTDEVLSLAA